MKKGTLTVRIGLDDTDHPDFGCTTYSFDGLMSSLNEMRGLKICLLYTSDAADD